MQPYQVKLTIYGMEGAFIDKYSFTVTDAHLLNRYFQEYGGEGVEAITIMEQSDYQLGHDPMALFPVLMKHLRMVATKRAKRPFYTGVRFVPAEGGPGVWEERCEAEDERGQLVVEAFGAKAILVRGEAHEELERGTEEIQVKGGVLQLRSAQLQELFKEPLMGMITIAEEALAKNESLVATAMAPESDVQQGDFLIPE